MLTLLGSGFNLNFRDSVLESCFGTTFYGSGLILDGFMILDVDKHELSNDSCYSLMATTRNSCNDMILWHFRLGHIGQKIINRLARENLLGQFTKINITTCKYCLAGKLTRKPIGIGTRAEKILQLIHFGICGPMSVKARHIALYFITFIDDFYSLWSFLFYFS